MRKIDYLRLSVTDRCNLRCMYCVPPQGIEIIPQYELLTFEEIRRLVEVFAGLGVRRVRLTGGEPLVRRGVIGLIRLISGVRGVEELSMTTNGVLLSRYAGALAEAGIRRLNISLDTLERDKFLRITGRDCFHQVLGGIESARSEGLSDIKLNMVVMKGINDDEIGNFLRFSISRGIVLRFIEFMKVTPLWKKELFLPIEEVKKICERETHLVKTEERGPGPAEYYRTGEGIVGFIKTDKENCSSCSRVRLTSTGELKLCLYQDEGEVLREALRAGHTDSFLQDLIETNLKAKPGRMYNSWQLSKSYMCSIGG